VGQILANGLYRRQAEAELGARLAAIEELKGRLEAENLYLRDEVTPTHGFEQVVGRSAVMRAVLERAAMVADAPTTVLLLGETGTGKEILAEAIHRRSSRGRRMLVKVNCAALPPTLVESELFGHEKGAFTGATAAKVGRFELADGGTLLLDEIGDLPVDLQPKLLRVLQKGEFERVGGTRTQTVDVRVIAATNRDLPRAVAEGRFRDDLYYGSASSPSCWRRSATGARTSRSSCGR
jgi:transcriptional regulator with GAF, ATPase, and Fis domain